MEVAQSFVDSSIKGCVIPAHHVAYRQPFRYGISLESDYAKQSIGAFGMVNLATNEACSDG